MYRDPSCYIADIEVMAGVSYRTAQRILSKVRKYYGITGRKKPTIQQVQTYMLEIK